MSIKPPSELMNGCFIQFWKKIRYPFSNFVLKKVPFCSLCSNGCVYLRFIPVIFKQSLQNEHKTSFRINERLFYTILKKDSLSLTLFYILFRSLLLNIFSIKDLFLNNLYKISIKHPSGLMNGCFSQFWKKICYPLSNFVLKKVPFCSLCSNGCVYLRFIPVIFNQSLQNKHKTSFRINERLFYTILKKDSLSFK